MFILSEQVRRRGSRGEKTIDTSGMSLLLFLIFQKKINKKAILCIQLIKMSGVIFHTNTHITTSIQ